MKNQRRNTMIDEKELIEEIKSLQITVNGLRAGKGILRGFAKHYKEIILRIIEEQPKVGEWIPVSERFPEDNEMSEYYDSVIVALDDGRVAIGFYSNKNEEWWADSETGEPYAINVTGHVIAWMPLPKAYEGEQK